MMNVSVREVARTRRIVACPLEAFVLKRVEGLTRIRIEPSRLEHMAPLKHCCTISRRPCRVSMRPSLGLDFLRSMRVEGGIHGCEAAYRIGSSTQDTRVGHDDGIVIIRKHTIRTNARPNGT